MDDPDLRCVMRSYAQAAVKGMIDFVDNSSIYKNFPEVSIDVTEQNTGCFGGVRQEGDKFIPCIILSIPYITSYTAAGFPEYNHIEDDPEIGSIMPVSWEHTVAIVLSHELAHAVINMHELTKRFGLFVPRTYRSYSVDMIPEEYKCQKKAHGRHWQFVYRELRNKFANVKNFC